MWFAKSFAPNNANESIQNANDWRGNRRSTRYASRSFHPNQYPRPQEENQWTYAQNNPTENYNQPHYSFNTKNYQNDRFESRRGNRRPYRRRYEGQGRGRYQQYNHNEEPEEQPIYNESYDQFNSIEHPSINTNPVWNNPSNVAPLQQQFISAPVQGNSDADGYLKEFISSEYIKFAHNDADDPAFMNQEFDIIPNLPPNSKYCI